MAQDGEIRVRLHRVAQLRVETRQSALQAAEVVLHRRRAVDIRRRAVEFGDRREIDRFTMEIGAGVLEMMHEQAGVEKSADKIA